MVELKHEQHGAETRLVEPPSERDTTAPGIPIHFGEHLQILATPARLCAEEVLDGEHPLQMMAARIATITGDACMVRLLANDGTLLCSVAGPHPDPLQREAIRAALQQTTQRTDVEF